MKEKKDIKARTMFVVTSEIEPWQSSLQKNISVCSFSYSQQWTCANERVSLAGSELSPCPVVPQVMAVDGQKCSLPIFSLAMFAEKAITVLNLDLLPWIALLPTKGYILVGAWKDLNSTPMQAYTHRETKCPCCIWLDILIHFRVSRGI